MVSAFYPSHRHCHHLERERLKESRRETDADREREIQRTSHQASSGDRQTETAEQPPWGIQ